MMRMRDPGRTFKSIYKPSSAATESSQEPQPQEEEPRLKLQLLQKLKPRLDSWSPLQSVPYTSPPPGKAPGGHTYQAADCKHRYRPYPANAGTCKHHGSIP